MVFAQVVIGPPGSGKTTYCEGMRQYLEGVGRQVAIINLDPANDALPYTAAADVRDLVSAAGAASEGELGPNGALVYCLEYLEANLDWLTAALARLSGHYVLLDMPGQVELYTHHGSVRAILQALERADHRLVAVHLVDAHHCADAAKFISVLLVTLSTMVQLELPQVNFLSKIDLVEAYGQLAFNLDFYTDVADPAALLPCLQAAAGSARDTPFNRRHAALNAAICELVDDFSLVQFGTIDISDRASVARALRSIDKANGYCFGAAETQEDFFSAAAADADFGSDHLADIQERYMDRLRQERHPDG